MNHSTFPTDVNYEDAYKLVIHIQYISILTDINVIRGLLEKYPTFGREKETGLLGALDT